MAARYPEELAEDLQCPICFNYPQPGQVLQCHNGHIICLECRQQLIRCPICNQDYTMNIRAPPVFNKLLSNVKQMCSNNGCEMMIIVKDLVHHERHLCGWQPVRCPLRNCQHMDPLCKIIDHIRNGHTIVNNLRGARNKLKDVLELPDNWKTTEVFDIKPIIIEENGQNFVLMGTKYENSFYFDVVFIGTPEASQNFTYCLSFTSGNRVAARKTENEIPIPIDQARNSWGTSLVVSAELFSKFLAAGPYNNIQYSFVVKKN